MATQTQIYSEVKADLKALASQFEADDFYSAINDALRETSWSLPTTDGTQIYWIKRRAKRHLYAMMLSVSAHKFKFEQINLQHRFDHYFKLVEKEDEVFESYLDTLLLADIATVNHFGTKIDAGFSQDQFGRETTYDDDNLVVIHQGDSG